MNLFLRMFRGSETLLNTIQHRSTFFRIIIIPGEARRATRFINLSHGIAWGSREDCLVWLNLGLPIYILRRCPQLPSNKTKSWPLTIAHSHVSSVLASLGCILRTFACRHVYSSSVNKLRDQFLMQMRDTSKDSNAWFNKWLEIHSGGGVTSETQGERRLEIQREQRRRKSWIKTLELHYTVTQFFL